MSSMTIREVRIAIIIVNCDDGSLLDRGIASIAEQTLPPSEIVLVGDKIHGSHSSTVSWWVRDCPVRSGSTAKSCLATRRNLGVAHSTADYIAFLDPGDQWLPSHLEELAKPFLITRVHPL